MLIQRFGDQKMLKNKTLTDGIIDCIVKNKGSCDEVWLATPYGYPKNDDLKDFIKITGEYADLLREKGITVSLQISNTLGHGGYIAKSALFFGGRESVLSKQSKFLTLSSTLTANRFAWN